MIEILMPYYGDPALLRVAVNSVLDQDSPEWRLVVVDNDYPDREPGDWVSSIDDPRIHYVRNERNLGVSGNLRRCLEIATAPHFTIMGADDVMHANYVSSVSRAVAAHPGAAMVQPRVQVIDSLGRRTSPLGDRIKARLAPPPDHVQVLRGPRLAASLLIGNWAYFPAITLRRTALAERSFRPDMETVFDLDLLMNLILDGEEFVLLDEVAFSYRRHSASISSLSAADTARFDEEARLYKELVPHLERIGWRRPAWAARLHLTSRLHALTLVPRAVSRRQWATVGRLVRHATGLTGR